MRKSLKPKLYYRDGEIFEMHVPETPSPGFSMQNYGFNRENYKFETHEPEDIFYSEDA